VIYIYDEDITQLFSNPKDVTVLIDVDDTLIDLLPAWVDWLNEHHGLNVDYESITEWDMMKFFPTLTKEQVFAPLGDMLFWSGVKPKNGAERYLKMIIKQGFDCYLCSATHFNTVALKQNLVLRKYFPFISWDRVIITSHKDMIKGDILIDDGLHNFENVEAVKVVFDAPHNKYDRYVDNPFYDAYRVYNWKDVYNLLLKLAGLEPDDN
jgi:5'(3')-deoxyribonucleotidase